MALTSPGVEVKVINESFYTPAEPGTTPMIFVASASNKQNASGTGTAQGTLKANAGKPYLLTSQRDLADTFGDPLFYTDRHNHRTEWYNMIHNYCKDDLAKLGRNLYAKHDIYCGLRNKREFFAMQNEEIFDCAIWVDRSDHLPSEDPSSMSIEQWMCNYTIDNNGDLKRLEKNVEVLMKTIFKNQGLSRPDAKQLLLFA